MEGLKDIALRLQAIIDTAIDAIITIDEYGIIENFNNSAAKLFGYTPQEVIGQNVKVLMPDPYHSEHDGYIQRYKDTKERRIIGIGREVSGQKKNGVIFPIRLAVSEVKMKNRTIFTGIIHDLTEIKRVEKELIEVNTALEEKVRVRTLELETIVNQLLETNKKLQQRETELELALDKEKELSELKSRFVSMASHEFRTPLSTIMSSAALLSRYKLEAEQEKRERHVNRIKSSVVNLTGILNDFLSLSKLEEGKIALKISKIDPEELLKDTLEDIQGYLKKNQKFEIKIIGENGYVDSDRNILKNVLFNVLTNAIKYSEEGSGIECTIIFSKASFSIKVKDQGIGIPEEEQKYLFDRFFRASNVETIQGTGLGLNIVKQYVELLSGDIKFESRLGEGTTIDIKFPY
ncbi:PAS domain-containing sensor histidine kinase [Membranihabitans maritimus]|uniref:PAS domain-containing sensor histidine kinase n=1 Tax=Membranihabitans maritimus TaxID=2904244 RepID=UPI001F45D78B|nr:PAS domain-containing sensor histidine kinase [Membranihabitans maritimus]